ncbi:MAG: hypothetical protein WCI27_00325 [Candidatus Omnitrophota bacterium]
MIKIPLLSKREKKIVIGTVVVVLALAIDFGVRTWQKTIAVTEGQESKLEEQLEYARLMLKRSNVIEKNYTDVHARYPKLFGSNDVTRVMADLDAATKAAGVQVDIIRPVQMEVSTRYELSIRGSWPQILKFLQEAEGSANLFVFPFFTINPQLPSGELVVLAQVERINF